MAEEFDHLTMAPATCGGPEIDGLWTRFMAGFQQLADQRGLDLAYGRGLPGDLPAAGLQQVRSDAKVQFNPGGCPLSRVLALSILRMSDPLAGTGAVTAAELDRLVVLLADPSFVWMSQLMVVAWGRREG